MTYIVKIDKKIEKKTSYILNKKISSYTHIIMSHIYYTLQSSTAVLGVYCNNCNTVCSFAYSSYHPKVAFFTKNKDKILCPDCALDFPDQVYRPVLSTGDIPIYRSSFKSNSYDDYQMFCNYSKNSHQYYFCTEIEEQTELKSGIYKKEQCSCRPDDLNCPNNPDLHLVQYAKKYSNNEFDVIPYSQFHNTLIQKLFSYNYIDEFHDDELVIDGQKYLIVKSQIMVGMRSSPWKEISLKTLQVRLVKKMINENVSFKIKYKNVDPDRIWIYITPDPIFLYENEKDIDILLQLESINFNNTERIKILDKYPNVEPDGKIKGKPIEKIRAFKCPCVYDEVDRIKKSKCRHNLYIYYKDGSSLMCGSKLTLNEIAEKGYLPYIKQYRPKSQFKYNIQLNWCELSKEIGAENLIFFK